MNWQERAGRLICFCVWAGMAYLLMRYALGALLPFLIALLFSMVLSPVVSRLAAVCRLPRKLCAFCLVAVAWLGFGCFLSAISARFVGEAEALLHGLRSESTLGQVWLDLYDRLPEWMKNGADLLLAEPWAQDLWKQLVSAVTASLASAVGRILSATPTALMNVLITVVASFYLTMDKEKLLSFFKRVLPAGVRGQTARFLPHVKRMAGGYLRALCLLFLLTFFEVFIGLLILGRRYALLCALCVAAVDILPVLGSGTVLIPWAVVLFLQGQPTVGLGMLILYGVVTVVRQLAEPRLVGSGLGLHPLLSLLCMAVGLRLLGVIGMLVCPIAASLLLKLLEREPQKKSAHAKKQLDIGKGL